MTSFPQRYAHFILRHKKATLGILTLITLFFCIQLLSLQVNPSLFLLGKDFKGRVLMAEARQHFSGSGEQILVGVVTRKDSIFNPESLASIKTLTQQFARLTLIDEDDTLRLQDAAVDAQSRRMVEQILVGGITPLDKNDLKALSAYLATLADCPQDIRDYVADLAIRAAPVVKVRSLADVENIELDGDALDVHDLMNEVPADALELNSLAEEVFGNQMFSNSLISPQGKASMIQVELAVDEEDSRNLQRAYSEVLRQVNEIPSQDSYHIGGTATYYAAITDIVEKDNNKFLPFVVLVISLLLYLSFRRWQGVWIPLLIAILSLIWTMGLVSLTGFKLNIITNMIPVFIISIAVADSIHFITAYYEQAAEVDPEAAIEGTMHHLLIPMGIWSFTTFVGFLAMAFTNLTFIREFGIFVSIGVAFAFAITITLLPALLPYLKLPKQQLKKSNDNGFMLLVDRFSSAANRMSSHKPWRLLSLSLVILVATIYMTFQVRVDNENISSFSKSTAVRQDNDVLNQYFGGTVPVSIWLRSETRDMVKRPDFINALRLIEQRLKSHQQIGYTISPVSYLDRINELMADDMNPRLPANASEELISQYFLLYEFGNGSEIKDVIDYTYSSARIIGMAYTDRGTTWEAIIEDVRDYAATVVPKGVTVEVFGTGELQASNIPEIVKSEAYSFSFSFLLIASMMFAIFRSLKFGMVSMVPLTFTLAFIGALMLGLDIPLDIGTAMICGICFGVGVDYTIHFLSVYNTYATEPGTTHNEVLAKTVNSVARPIIINSLSLACGFAVLCLSNYAAIVNLGLLTAASMVICAVLTLILIPATLRVCVNFVPVEQDTETLEPIAGQSPRCLMTRTE
ncbi:putative RND superfamily exporter [Pseudomonas chlororaphis subsp. aurantiaca]|uniref:efflux RND transporter permease subunit n=1 Tax=Pseudomonas chlororaphis TaxID=587753 RepID=UPI00086674BD|nr:efflux RND transporter permease subunit [Pseudomonas chlororaphis]BAV75633.1 putative RND superfamily exporter [Pseudomonas chlororaphis subsp. aurantiaca]